MDKVINGTYKIPMNIQVESGYDAYASGIPTESMHMDEDHKYTITELIAMLEKAQDRWGDIPVRISDVGFEASHYNDTIGIYQLYLYKTPKGKEFCVIESTP